MHNKTKCKRNNSGFISKTIYNNNYQTNCHFQRDGTHIKSNKILRSSLRSISNQNMKDESKQDKENKCNPNSRNKIFGWHIGIPAKINSCNHYRK